MSPSLNLKNCEIILPPAVASGKEEWMPEGQQVQFKVNFEDPKAGPVPLFSNHVGISRAGTEVQFEFVFLDINLVANILQTYKAGTSTTAPLEVTGRTVAKVVMPMHVFLQLGGHLQTMVKQIEQELRTEDKEEHERSISIPNV
jgi:hypothetical protein